ncbi:MAG: hypothetical protein M5R42_14765 [Rhodocyclaceae bacterium]|nr:hypothetical protein [Rhodocyclaceae bacterium]
MSKMRQHTVQCLSPGGLHRMAYVEWGDPKNARVLVCGARFTRNARLRLPREGLVAALPRCLPGRGQARPQQLAEGEGSLPVAAVVYRTW